MCVANIVVFKNLFEQYRKEILQSRLPMIEGNVQTEGKVIHVIARTLHNLSHTLTRLLRQWMRTHRNYRM